MRHPRLVNGTVPILLHLSVLKCCAPYAGGSPGALDQFFPAGGWLGWVLGAPISIFTAFMVSMVGTGVGLYVALRITKRLLP